MERLTHLLSGALVVLLVISVTAQTRPDFSGRWTSGTEPTATASGAGGRAGERAGDMGSGWGSSITVAQDANRLTVEYTFFARGDMQPPLKFVYALDGSETKNSV